ncbi:tectonic-3 [Neodiprion fabricii]|uniref:tectonic-3 n=1 Tax=Neodiprion fabricii TaxID=2872261 RepID=UPI001ED8D9C2|nr:tectonic-3 [Neodiprion fabricii]
MHLNMIRLLCYVAVLINAQSTEITLDKSTSTCLNDTDCDVSESTNDSVGTTTQEIETSQTVPDDISKDKNLSVKITSPLPDTTSSKPFTSSAKPFVGRPQNREDNCHCDLTISSCDINCCCDVDCNDLNVTELFACKDHRPKVYDTRYCWDENYIQDNKTRYLLEKLRDNLFCIVHENLPPVYSIGYDPIISNRTTLDEIVRKNKKSRFKWEQSAIHVPLQFNSETPYRHGDNIWKIQNGFIKQLELPQTGFTGICSFKKALKYLEEWSDSCMQISLENQNVQLFAETFNNFTIIASPVLYNDSNFKLNNQTCPRTICVPVKSYYCLGSWNLCKNESTPTGKCNKGTCTNIVRSVRYVFAHNGIKGMNALDVYLKIGNASQGFYQKFEVFYKWFRDDQSKVFHLSGNPGYILGKPIIIGELITNKTNTADYSYVYIDKTDYFLSLPVSRVDGQCDKERRYAVNFGEDLKLSCKIHHETRNFTIKSCIDLQKLIIEAMLKKILFNVSEVDQHRTYVAKWNYLRSNNTDDWLKIIFDRMPQTVVTAQIVDDQLICSGLVTSLRIDIVHRRLSEPQTVDNYKILGIGITFSEESDIYWIKCDTKNCADLLVVDIVSYVIFHDVSRPSKYFFAEGPNLDITLPQDFFYPFINNAPITQESHLLALCTFLALIITY